MSMTIASSPWCSSKDQQRLCQITMISQVSQEYHKRHRSVTTLSHFYHKLSRIYHSVITKLSQTSQSHHNRQFFRFQRFDYDWRPIGADLRAHILQIFCVLSGPPGLVPCQLDPMVNRGQSAGIPGNTKNDKDTEERVPVQFLLFHLV
jgi:ribosomal protein S18